MCIVIRVVTEVPRISTGCKMESFLKVEACENCAKKSFITISAKDKDTLFIPSMLVLPPKTFYTTNKFFREAPMLSDRLLDVYSSAADIVANTANQFTIEKVIKIICTLIDSKFSNRDDRKEDLNTRLLGYIMDHYSFVMNPKQNGNSIKQIHMVVYVGLMARLLFPITNMLLDKYSYLSTPSGIKMLHQIVDSAFNINRSMREQAISFLVKEFEEITTDSALIQSGDMIWKDYMIFVFPLLLIPSIESNPYSAVEAMKKIISSSIYQE